MDSVEGMLMTMLVLAAVLLVLMIVVHWRIYEKAGQPGWASLVPFYNTYVLIVNILHLSPAWFWLLLIPIVNIFVAIPLIFMIPFGLAEKFGKGSGFGLGLLLLGVVFYPLLAFGDARYMNSRPRRQPGGYGDFEEEEEAEYGRRKW